MVGYGEPMGSDASDTSLVDAAHARSPRGWARPMAARDPHESHRAATPLELLFDLCFVVAVAQTAAGLHHGLAEAHFGEAVLAYVLVFFALWWAWMNFTWFASAYDTDDVPYRLAVLVQIAGALMIAAGVPRAFEERDFTVVTFGFAVMRVGLIVNWLRAARADSPHGRTARRYAIGLGACQVGWLSLLGVPPGWWLAGWFVLAPAELLVPIWAERAEPTTWHPHHIAERYGLLTLIVLGEVVLAATLAIQAAFAAGEGGPALAVLAAGGLVVIFSMWWIYFDRPAGDLLTSSGATFLWGYSHLLVFAATAAVGAGIGVTADRIVGRSAISPRAAGAAVAVPVALYLLCVWALHVRPSRRERASTAAFLVTAALVLAAPLVAWPVVVVGLLLAGLVAVLVATERANGTGSGSDRVDPER
jgi:low temperature requirement protein LtrA